MDTDRMDEELLRRLSEWQHEQSSIDGDTTDGKKSAKSGAGAESKIARKLGISVGYDMSHQQRGRFLIINNTKFDSTTKMDPRKSSDRDAAILAQVFEELGFDVDMRKDQNTTDMLRLFTNAAEENHENRDCFACAILSHGADGEVYGTNGTIEIDKLLKPFKESNNHSLSAKPKLFFIQACRGEHFDVGVEVADSDVCDGNGGTGHVIPIESDYLIAHSTCKGYFSWRGERTGSWFIQTLCQVVSECGHRKDIMWILTAVNQIIAQRESKVLQYEKKYMDRRKQSPCIFSTLRKLVYFPPKCSGDV